MSFSQLGFPQFLSSSHEVYAGERPGSAREGGADSGASPSATAAAVSSVLGMYGNPWAHNCSAFLPYGGATDLALISQMGPQFDLKEGPGAHSAALPVHAAQGFYPYGQYPYGDPSRAKAASRETTSTLKAWLQEHQKNPYPTKGEKIMLAIITKMTLTQVSTWFANARRRLKKENKVTWGRSAEDRDGRIFSSDNEEDTAKNGSDDEDEEEEEIDLETVDVERPEEHREDLGCEKGEAGIREESDLKNFEANTRDLSEDGVRGASQRPIALIKAAGGNIATDNSPTIHECQRAPQSKPKIWSLAEIATSPDNAQHKLSSVPQYIPSPTLSTAGHPALLPGHGIYTCQIGKLHNWTNAAFLNATSLVNMKLLGVGPNGHLPLQARHDARLVDVSGASGTEEDSEGESSDGFSPKQDGEESNHRPNTPKSSFQLITGRSHPGTATQRILTTTL